MENLTNKELKERLKELIGKDYKDSCHYDVAVIVKKLLKENHWDCDYVRQGARTKNLSYTSDKFKTLFCWCGEFFMSIEIKRKKGETHHRSYYNGGSYTDYTIKDFEIFCPFVSSNEIEDSIKSANDRALKDKKEYEARVEQAVEAFKMVMEKFGMDKWRARDLFEFTVGRAYYDVLKKIDPEK
jgi:hypothetical protein